MSKLTLGMCVERSQNCWWGGGRRKEKAFQFKDLELTSKFCLTFVDHAVRERSGRIVNSITPKPMPTFRCIEGAKNVTQSGSRYKLLLLLLHVGLEEIFHYTLAVDLSSCHRNLGQKVALTLTQAYTSLRSHKEPLRWELSPFSSLYFLSVDS